MKTEEGDWTAVSSAAGDLRAAEALIQASLPPQSLETPIKPKESKPAAVEEGLETPPPTEMEIKHNVNKVQSLLNMGDEELVDALFPEGEPSA